MRPIAWLAGGLICLVLGAQEQRALLELGALRGEIAYDGKAGGATPTVVAVGRFSQASVRAEGPRFFFPELRPGRYDLFVVDPAWCQTGPRRVDVFAAQTARAFLNVLPRGESKCISTDAVRYLGGPVLKYSGDVKGTGRIRLAVFHSGGLVPPPVDIKLEPYKSPGVKGETKNVDVSRVIDVTGLTAPRIYELEIDPEGPGSFRRNVYVTPDRIIEIEVDLRTVMRGRAR